MCQHNQGNTNQNHSEIPLHTPQGSGIKNRTITRVGKDVEKLESVYTASTNVKWCSCYGKQSDSFSMSYT